MAELRSNKTAQPERREGPTIEEWLGDPRFQESVASLLPRHLTGERFAAIALRQFKLVPTLRECTPASILASMIDAAQLGLEIGLGGECWIIPYKFQGTMTASMQIGYLGHLKLAWQSGMVASVEAGVATREEVDSGRFEFQHGTSGYLHHRPIEGRELNEKTIAYAYGIVWAKGADRPVWRVLDAKDIDRIRRTGRSANSPAWMNWFDEMAMAKALKRTLKWAPKSRELGAAIALDDEADAGVPQSYGSRGEVAGLLAAARVVDPATQAMQDALGRQGGVSGPGGPSNSPNESEGEAGDGTPPPRPIDSREPVPVEARRPASKPAPGGGLGL